MFFTLQTVRIGVDITIYPMMIYNQIYVGLKIEKIGVLCRYYVYKIWHIGKRRMTISFANGIINIST